MTPFDITQASFRHGSLVCCPASGVHLCTMAGFGAPGRLSVCEVSNGAFPLPELAVRKGAALVGKAAAVVQVQLALRAAAAVERHHLTQQVMAKATSACMPGLWRAIKCSRACAAANQM